jgi:UDP-N-acetylmuramate: L-alanyl-gamma-D-glutamyl-meso-diaminopimelate ligase
VSVLAKKKVHLIGICGTAMAALACMLKERGWSVGGSDAAAYPPMSEILRQREIVVSPGYQAERIGPDLDLVVVGNVAAASNVEALRAGELKLVRRSLPETLWHEFLVDKPQRLVVAGTHGKTTTSSLLAWGLESAGCDPSFMIGGELKNFAANYKLGSGDAFVLEGDEYNSAFFDRHAKFHH